MFRHDAFENVELHTVARWAKVKVEGPADKFFETVPALDPEQARQENVQENGGEEQIPDHVFHLSGQAEDIAHVRGLGFEVDDDNDPAPENIPGEPNNTPANSQDDNPNHVKAAPELWEGVCPRKRLNMPNTGNSLWSLGGDHWWDELHHHVPTLPAC